MKKVQVLYTGWGEKWHLGTLADDGRHLLFEYSKEALSQGLELSPVQLKLRTEAYGSFPDYLMRLPGFIADQKSCCIGTAQLG
jgi:serine/threonine-protein kinase HipA